MWAWARLQAAGGRHDVYVYRFDHRPPFPADSIYADWGAAHFVELWYVFDHLDQQPWPWTAADRRLADLMAGYWTNFVKHGDPNGPGLPAWPRFTKEDAQAMRLDDPARAGAFPVDKGLETMDTLYSQVRGAPLGVAQTPASPSSR